MNIAAADLEVKGGPKRRGGLLGDGSTSAVDDMDFQSKDWSMSGLGVAGSALL